MKRCHVGLGVSMLLIFAPTAANATVSTGIISWLDRSGAAEQITQFTDAATSPDGKVVYAAGIKATNNEDYVVRAFDASTGSTIWTSLYDNPNNGSDEARDIAVTPDGKTVIVTGESRRNNGFDFLTIAYDAANGNTRWIRRLDSSSHLDDYPRSIAISPSGRSVYVAGRSARAQCSYSEDCLIFSGLVVGYDLSSGTQRWAKRFTPLNDVGFEAATVSPDGYHVYVTGWGEQDRCFDVVTMALRYGTGQRMWTSIRDVNRGCDVGYKLVRSPSGKTLYVAASWNGACKVQCGGAALLSLDTATGTSRWLVRRSTFVGKPASVVVSSTGSTMYLAGTEVVQTLGQYYGFVTAYSYKGSVRWSAHIFAPWVSRSVNTTIADASLSADGTRVVVTGSGFGQHRDVLTASLATASGNEIWIHRLDIEQGDDSTSAIAAAKDGSVYVTGSTGAHLADQTTGFVARYLGDGAVSRSPTAPSSLTAGPGSDANTARLSWTAPSDEGGTGLARYIIERAGGDGVFSRIATVATYRTTYQNAGLTSGQAYRYRVRAQTDVAIGPASVEACVLGGSPSIPVPC